MKFRTTSYNAKHAFGMFQIFEVVGFGKNFICAGILQCLYNTKYYQNSLKLKRNKGVILSVRKNR